MHASAAVDRRELSSPFHTVPLVENVGVATVLPVLCCALYCSVERGEDLNGDRRNPILFR